ncbi:MAG: Hsp70 family protein [Chloroflexi bacterium]|nr:Hsp70 family protein [Chloroflexota bacterium]
MPGRLAVDFGTSNTVVALWDETQGQGLPIHIPEFGQILRQGVPSSELSVPAAEPGVPSPDQGAAGSINGVETISVIPSLIHYAPDNRTWIGNQVVERGLRQSNRTFRWMKRYISHRSPLRVRIDGNELTPYTAGQDFLTSVLVFAGQEIGFRDEEVAFSVPVEAFEHYENWLTSVAETAGMPRFRLIDEPSAAALGYGAHIQPGNVYLLFDFGGGTMHAVVVLIEAAETAAGGRRCRVLGKSGRDIGGTTIDQWIFQDALRQNHRTDSDADVRRISTALLVECERVKEALSFEDYADISVVNPETGAALSASFTRAAFEDLLDRHDLYTEINQTVRAAVNAATERGYDEQSIQSVLMVGGSSQIPSVQRTLRQMFGRERVRFNRPLDAVARGAAAFVAGVDFFDHIQHDYAIRYVNPSKGTYDYRTIIKRGTTYPTREPVAKLAIKASYDDQKHLGIAIYELSEQRQRASTQPVELVFDPSGAARITRLTPDDQEKRAMFWMNENNQTFLTADPPARRGEARFEVEFSIDENKRLTITARDIKTGRLTHKDYPVVKLT